MSNLAILTGWHCGCFFPRDRMRSCMLVVTSAGYHRPYLYLSDIREPYSPRATAWGHRSVSTYFRQWSRVNHATIRAQDRNALQIFRQNWPFGSRNCTYLVIITAVTQNHGNCRKSRHKAKITVITAIVNSWFTYIPTHYTGCCRIKKTSVHQNFATIIQFQSCIHTLFIESIKTDI